MIRSEKSYIESKMGTFVINSEGCIKLLSDIVVKQDGKIVGGPYFQLKGGEILILQY